MFIDKLLTLLQNDSDSNVRARAASALGKFAFMAEMDELPPRRAKKLTAALLDAVNGNQDDIEVRCRALEAIGVSSLPEVKKAISEAYQSGISLLRLSAIYAMGQNCDPVWLSTLLQELRNENPAARYEAAVACGEIEEQEAVPHLIALVKDPDHEVRLATVDALGKIGGSQAKKALQECLEGTDPGLRSAALDALKYLEMQEDPISFTYGL